MAQRIKKVVMTGTDLAFTKYNVTYYIEGTGGDVGGIATLTEVAITAINTPLKVGLLLVGAFPQIDLPTS